MPSTTRASHYFGNAQSEKPAGVLPAGTAGKPARLQCDANSALPLEPLPFTFAA